MSKFFFADGRIEDHSADNSHPRWELYEESNVTTAFTAGELSPAALTTITVNTFERQPDGTWWQCAPEYFNPSAALSRLADEVERQKALVLKASRALREAIHHEVDPFHGHEVLRDLRSQGVAWWTEDED